MLDIREKFHRPIDEVLWRSLKEWRITIFCVLATTAAGFFTLFDQFPILWEELNEGDWKGGAGHFFYLCITALLVYGGLVYQITRAFYIRRNTSARNEAYEYEASGMADVTELTVLVPTFKEEYTTIYQTLISAALQEDVEKRIVLLIDNPPDPSDESDVELLRQAREMPNAINALLRPMAESLAKHREQARSLTILEEQKAATAQAFEECGNWFSSQAALILNTDLVSHTDRFFAMEVLLTRAYTSWQYAVSSQTDAATEESIEQSWSKMTSWFQAEVTCFERKTFENCTHESNKAANLNSYLGLMGHCWHVTRGNDGRHQLQLKNTSEGADIVGELDVPDSAFVVTLDADSLLLPGYAKHLTDDLKRPGFEKVAVIQTPYSAIPGAECTLERVAGATTDVQYIIHQGFTAWNATYWVGANALMRKEALEEIVQPFMERGFSMKRYIQDRTVIEDTESTIDLLQENWTLWNHPARLAYSATPPDFGSLLIQRRRWANGGLLILPKAIAYLRRKTGFVQRLKEGFMRLHYLVSITSVNFGLLLLLAFPITDSVGSFWLPLTAVPYFYLYGRDLRLMNYKGFDVFRVYALNLLLIPVNIGGVVKSLQQCLTKRKIPFSRTPKVTNRTPVLSGYVLAAILIFSQWTAGAYWDFNNGYPSQGFFAAANALILGYALLVFVGFRNTLKDLFRFNAD